ncbi:MAG TPA: YkvA family protein [Myxococcota bacterium]
MTSSEPVVEIDLSARERRVYDRWRAALRRPLPGASPDLRDALFALPDLVVLVLRLLRDSRVRPGDKAMAVLGVAYVLSPIDLLPEFLFGPIGLLDDALVLALTVSRLVNRVHPDVVRAHWSGQGEVLDAIQRVSGWAERQLGGRMRRTIERWSR